MTLSRILSNFNSIKVQLKHIMTCRGFFDYYFNSIKVQLKQMPEETKALYNLFQFHKGTIKTKIYSDFCI